MKPSATRGYSSRKTLWKEVITVALAVKRRNPKRFVPLRGYSAEEIIEYLLSELYSELTQEEKQHLKRILSPVT